MPIEVEEIEDSIYIREILLEALRGEGIDLPLKTLLKETSLSKTSREIAFLLAGRIDYKVLGFKE